MNVRRPERMTPKPVTFTLEKNSGKTSKEALDGSPDGSLCLSLAFKGSQYVFKTSYSVFSALNKGSLPHLMGVLILFK